MSHELGHCFGCKHCVHFNCLMQGSNNGSEAEKKLHDVCPICLKKMFFACEFDPAVRYQKLKDWCDGLIEEGPDLQEELYCTVDEVGSTGKVSDDKREQLKDAFEVVFGDWSEWYSR